MSFASGVRELRGDVLSMLETHRGEFIDVLPQSYSRVPPRSYSHTSPRTSSHAFSQFPHGPNHPSYGYGPRENHFEPRCFGYNLRPRCGDCFPRRPGFPAKWSFTHFELRHLDGPRFPRRGSRPT
jgi:hypothetical protein